MNIDHFYKVINAHLFIRLQKLHDLLQADAHGRMIVAVYASGQFLTPSARNRLVRLIIKKEQDDILRDLSEGQQLHEFVYARLLNAPFSVMIQINDEI